MTVTADQKKRVILPVAKPGDRFDVSVLDNGTVLFTKLVPMKIKPVTAKIELHNGQKVGVLSRPLNEAALNEALAELP